MSSDPDRTDAAIASYLRHRSSSRGRGSQRVGPFLATFRRGEADPMPGYAVPDDWAQPSSVDVENLVQAYEARGEVPRLRYLAPLAPHVAAAVARCGFGVEDDSAVMTLRMPGLAPEMIGPPPPPAIEFVLARSDAELAETRQAQRQAYGTAVQPRQDGVARLRIDVEAGAIAVLARDTTTGTPAGAGICSIPFDGVTELFGVAVAEAYRQRGIARVLTIRLVSEALAAGVETVFLVPADRRIEQGVYVPAGFSRTSRMVQLSLDR